jgi:hypothetical protein
MHILTKCTVQEAKFPVKKYRQAALRGGFNSGGKRFNKVLFQLVSLFNGHTYCYFIQTHYLISNQHHWCMATGKSA